MHERVEEGGGEEDEGVVVWEISAQERGVEESGEGLDRRWNVCRCGNEGTWVVGGCAGRVRSRDTPEEER